MSLPRPQADTPEAIRQALNAAFDRILESLGGPKRINFGTAVLAYPGGSVFATEAPITHGLGATPIVALATNIANSGLTAIASPFTRTYGATTFSLGAGTIDGQTPLSSATSTFVWLAIG